LDVALHYRKEEAAFISLLLGKVVDLHTAHPHHQKTRFLRKFLSYVWIVEA
jgi:hypothetical protein